MVIMLQTSHCGATARFRSSERLSDIEVHLELVGVRAEADRVDLVLALPLDPRLDEVLGEHATLKQEVVVDLQGAEHLGQRAGDRLDLGVLLRGELVEVLVDRLRGLDAVCLLYTSRCV